MSSNTGFHQVLIGGYPSGGLIRDRKPLVLPNEAYSDLENAYVFRERTKKRDGEVPMGRLTRSLSMVTLTATGSGTNTIVADLFADSAINLRTLQPYAQIVPGTLVVTFNTATYTDITGTGTLTVTGTGGVNGVIVYNTGLLNMTTSSSFSGQSIVVSFSYYPTLPAMGILKRDVASIGIDSTVFFDTQYAYQFVSGFQELSVGTTWTGTNTDFFCAANYQGATPDLRYFFTTNNNIDLVNSKYDPIRYFNNSSWNNLEPLMTATTTLWQALIIIPYYGRLLALNTWEGLTASTYTGAKNYFARCRFSQLGDPTSATAWRSDIFGLGGFLDAPTNEAIVSAAFFRNTLIVFFEYSTWQLRYVGEYGLPFIWERVSSDFGAVSPYSAIVFDQGVMVVGDRGIIQAAANGVYRLDDQIPEEVFGFEIQNSAPNFVHGVRDFEKELVYWNYFDSSNSSTTQSFPNTTLVFNYRNNTWAKFRDNITCFGTAQFQFGITWDSTTTYWESNVSWDNVDDQNYVDYVACGTQQGFINIYQNPDAETPVGTPINYAPCLSILAINTSDDPYQFTIPNHNLKNGELIYIQNTLWSGGSDPGFNNQIFQVTVANTGMPAMPNPNIITLSIWKQGSQSYSSVDSSNFPTSAVYIGNGIVTLLPKMNIQGKDFNPFQESGKQFKLSYIDFQMDSNLFSPAIGAVTVQLFVNSYLNEQANLISTNQELLNSSQNCGYIIGASKSDPCIITSLDHSLITGTVIYIANVKGMTQLNAALYTITVVDVNNFTLNNTDSSGYTAYAGGGIWNTSPINGQTYIPGTEYAWYRFYSTQFGQYLRVGLTYDDNLMNQVATHQTPMELNAMNFWFREGGRLVN